MLLLSLVVASAALAAADPQLVHVQVLWRHGDRTPIGSYKSDPYNETFWGQPWGNLTTIGMEQQFLQGTRLRQRYIDKYALLPKDYKSPLIKIRSSETGRCVESAASNFAAFFSESQGTHPNNPNWPTNWTPVPIQSVPIHEDRLLELGKNCPFADIQLARRAAHPKFLSWMMTKSWLIDTIVKNTGDKSIKDLEGVVLFFDTILIEKVYRKLPLPAWVTDDFVNQLEQMVSRATHYVFGGADFGQPADTLLSQVWGGPLLKEMIGNMQAAVNGSIVKYHAYSAHDTTIVALLSALGAVEQVLPTNNPHYAAIVAVELWKGDDGKYETKVLYSADAQTDFVPITQYVSGCPTGDMCPLDTFIQRSQDFIPGDLEKECAKL